jgi:hypothetical protein
MPALDSLMKRFGFVRLARYGLVLTPEGRIMSLRPAVLDDGLGGRVVGWQHGDLAAMELQRWEPARPAPAPVRAVADRVAVIPPVPPRPPVARVAPVAIIPERAAPMAAIAAPVSAPLPIVPAVEVASAPQVEEDDWEWTIALARARAAADDGDTAAEAVQPPRLAAETVVSPPAPNLAAPTPRFMPVKTQPGVNVRSPLDTDSWPKTEPLGTLEYEDYTSPSSEIARIARLANALKPPVVIPAPKAPTPAAPTPVVRAAPRAASPATIIPIPKLPSVRTTTSETGRTSAIQPVVRAMATPIPAAPRRLAKGTGPVTQTVAIAPPPPIRSGEDTMPAFAIGDRTTPSLAIGDRTKPGIALPSIKQRLAR